jgi:hypothetical protein
MSQDDMKLGPIGQIAIPVTDLDRASLSNATPLE